MNKPKGHEYPIYEDVYQQQKPTFYPDAKDSNEYISKLLKKFFKKLDKNDRKLRITKTSNGFVVEYPNDNGGNFPPQEIYEYDIHMDIDSDKSKLVGMLYGIVEWMEVSRSRYDRERIEIRVVHGDKYECKDKKCSICSEK